MLLHDFLHFCYCKTFLAGSNGMGQAQSMSLGSSGCEDCSKYTDENVPDRYVQIPGIVNIAIRKHNFAYRYMHNE